MRTLAVCVALLAVATVAEAAPVTINFNAASTGNSYSESGFDFVAPVGNHHDSGTFGPAGSFSWHDGGSNTIFDNNIVMTPAGGGTFDLDGLDLVTNDSGTSVFLFDAGGFKGAFVWAAGMQIGTHNFSGLAVSKNLTSIHLRTDANYQGGGGPISAIDNLVVNNVQAPEPGSLALLGAGLVVLAVRRRRRA